MAKRKGNGKRGGRGGWGQGDNGRGRGWRGGGGGGRGRGRGVPGSYIMDEAFDFNIQMYADCA